MINGSTQILGNISGRYLNPFLLVESQASDNTGFVMVMYDIEPRRFDLLFLQGRSIIQCARMNQDLRFLIDQHAVTSAFNDQKETGSLFLFQCSENDLSRFLETFHAEPCLKVHVDTLSKPQLTALLNSTGCQRGIIERNDFSSMPPSIELVEIESSGTLPQFELGLKRGRLLVYDLMKNQEIHSQRFVSVSRGIVHPLKRKRRGKTTDIGNDTTQETAQPPSDDPNKSTADAVSDLIQEILGSQPESPDHASTKQTNDHTDTTLTSTLTLTSSESPQPSPINQQQTTNNHDQPQPSLSEASPELQPSNEEAVQTKETKQTEPTAFTRALERLLRSFRQQVVDICAQRAESIFAAAEKKARVLNPDLDTRSFDDNNAIVVLDLIEEMVKQAPLLKRSKLREIASELVSDLYNKQIDLLEQHKAVDAVEQCYYRLKGSK